jgi:glycosyltransferase involved in cell wall biosynthesis
LLALEPPGEDRSGLQAMTELCETVQIVPHPRWRTLLNGLLAIPSSTPFQAAYSRSPQMSQLIRQTEAKGDFDVVHVEHLRGAELAWAVQELPVVFDSVDSITLLFEKLRHSPPNWRSRLFPFLDLARTRRYEGQFSERFSRVLITSSKDREALLQLSSSPHSAEKVVVLPNGVDTSYFKASGAPRDPATVVFSGKMSYHANIAAVLDLAAKIMPLVWERLPKARLLIAGKDPVAEITALGDDPRITVTGTVPDLRPYLEQATVAVAPMRYGVGIQNKILEAMAMSTPVVTTSKTLSSLQVQIGQDILAADTPRLIADAIINLLSDKNLWQQISRAGRRYVETHHSWDAIAKKLTQIYRDAISEEAP